MPSFRLRYFTVGHFKISLSKLGKLLGSNLLIWPLWIGFSLLTILVLIWLPNMSLFFNVMTSGLSVGGKLEFLITSLQTLNTSYEPLEATLLAVIAVLQGLSLALLLVIWHGSKKRDAAGLAAGGVGTTIAVLGAGCGACGTSLIYPLLSSLGVTALSFSSLFGIGLMVVGVLVLLYSIHRILMVG